MPEPVPVRYHNQAVPADQRQVGDCWRTDEGHYALMTPVGLALLDRRWRVLGPNTALTVRPTFRLGTWHGMVQRGQLITLAG